jgi:PleD family two-component response regulator
MRGSTMRERLSESTAVRTGRATQNVVVVNGTPEVFDLIESVLDGGHYDMVFVADVDHAYSQIKQNHPDLVVVCLGFDDPTGFQVLSMLKLDAETRHIPLLTCANRFASDGGGGEPIGEDIGDALPLAARALPMN